VGFLTIFIILFTSFLIMVGNVFLEEKTLVNEKHSIGNTKQLPLPKMVAAPRFLINGLQKGLGIFSGGTEIGVRQTFFPGFCLFPPCFHPAFTPHLTEWSSRKL